MRTGRKPKPIAVHRMQGTFSATRHRHRKAEPKGGGELAQVRPPEWMTASQKRVWRQLIKDSPKGVLRNADRTMFRNFVVAAERFERAARMQNQMDATQTAQLLVKGTAGAAMISPYIRIMNRETIIMTNSAPSSALRQPPGRASVNRKSRATRRTVGESLAGCGWSAAKAHDRRR